jgi:hypothetical protein
VVVMAVLTRLAWQPGLVKIAMLSASGTYLLFDLGVRSAVAGSFQFHWLHSVAIAFSVALVLLFAGGRKLETLPQGNLSAVGWRFTALACWALLVGVAALYASLWWISQR